MKRSNGRSPARAAKLEGGLVRGLQVVHAAQGGAGRGDGNEPPPAGEVFKERSVRLARNRSSEDPADKVHDGFKTPRVRQGFPSVFGKANVASYQPEPFDVFV